MSFQRESLMVGLCHGKILEGGRREKAGERKKCLVDVGAFSSCMKPLSSHLETMVLKYLSPFRISSLV